MLQVLWAITFAGHLVLLVVLMGRDRVRRFPWFTANIAVVAFRLLTSRLLYGRLSQMQMATFFIVVACLGAFVSLMVVLELARRAFGKARRIVWINGALACILVGVLALWFWGAWPAWKTIVSGPPLQLAQLIAQKGMFLADVENIIVGLLIVVVGRRYGAGFRSHVQQIAIGLSTASIAQLSIQAIWESIARKAVAHSMEEYNRLINLRDHLFNTNNAIYIAVLLWWIVCLWIDEPGQRKEQGEVVRDQGPGTSDQEVLPAEDAAPHGRELPRGPEAPEGSQ